jgi:hypothetical protein
MSIKECLFEKISAKIGKKFNKFFFLNQWGLIKWFPPQNRQKSVDLRSLLRNK